MSPVMKAILTRRSIRRYTPQAVPEKIIMELLEAAMSAPSAGNEQPWEFVVITDRKVLDEIPRVHPYAQMCSQAPVAVLVCGDMQKETHQGFWVQDCSAATENLLIAVNDKGLGAVWVGVYPREERMAAMRKLVELPAHIIPFALIPIGYPAEKKPPSNRFDPSRVHKNKS
jgi:nitroreductase